jgi:hypothetical protein
MKIKKIENTNQFVFHCPGCNGHHAFNDTWEFNGDFEKPTLKPSVLVTWNELPKDATFENVPKGELHPDSIPMRCHSFITDGMIQFLGDCSHDKRNQTLELLDM